MPFTNCNPIYIIYKPSIVWKTGAGFSSCRVIRFMQEWSWASTIANNNRKAIIAVIESDQVLA